MVFGDSSTAPREQHAHQGQIRLEPTHDGGGASISAETDDEPVRTVVLPDLQRVTGSPAV